MSDDLEKIDKEIIELISKRTKKYVEELKSRSAVLSDSSAMTDKARADKIIESCNAGPISNDVFKMIYNELIFGTAALVKPVRVAYLGPAGTFSYMCMREIFGESAEDVPQSSIADVFRVVGHERVPLGVVPVENSTEGSVTFTLDEFIDTDLKIISEKYLRIAFSLLSNASKIDDVKTLYCNMQPLAQCKNWVRKKSSGCTDTRGEFNYAGRQGGIAE